MAVIFDVRREVCLCGTPCLAGEVCEAILPTIPLYVEQAWARLDRQAGLGVFMRGILDAETHR